MGIFLGNTVAGGQFPVFSGNTVPVFSGNTVVDGQSPVFFRENTVAGGLFGTYFRLGTSHVVYYILM